MPRISTTKRDRRKAVFAVNCAEKLSNQWYYQITRYFDRLNLSPLHIRAKPSANQLAYRNLSSLDKKLKEAPLMPWSTGFQLTLGQFVTAAPGMDTSLAPATTAGARTLALGSLNGGRHGLAGNSGEQRNGRDRFDGRIVGSGEKCWVNNDPRITNELHKLR
jgi:hypothetical protein